MTTSGQARQQKGTPAGGEFANQNRPESDLTLTAPTRTAFGGYELRGFRTAGTGMEGRIWSASIYKDGKKVLAVLEEGNGGDMRWTDLLSDTNHSSTALAEFRAVADKLHPEYADSHEGASGLLAETLQFSSELDKIARKHGIDRATIVDDHIRAGVLKEDERELFANPSAILDRD